MGLSTNHGIDLRKGSAVESRGTAVWYGSSRMVSGRQGGVASIVTPRTTPPLCQKLASALALDSQQPPAGQVTVSRCEKLPARTLRSTWMPGSEASDRPENGSSIKPI